MAVSGDTYLKSGWNGFMCNLKHMIEFYFAQDVGYFFIFIGKLTITALSLLTFWGLELATQGQTSTTGVLVTFAFCLLICFITLGLFNDAIIASLMCLSIDLDLNGGIPKYGNPRFHAKLDGIVEGKKVGNVVVIDNNQNI
jgi:hypothetical protein